MVLLCAGLAVCDVIASPVARTAMEVDTTRIDSLTMASGGDALNTACAIGKLGGQSVRLCARVGEDAFGRFVADQVAASGVESALIVDGDNATSTSLILVEPGGERHIVYYGACNDALSASDVLGVDWSGVGHLHIGSALALMGLDLTELLREAKRRNIVTSMDVTYDPTGRWMQTLEPALAYCDYFLPSLEEAHALTGETRPERIAAALSGFGIKGLAIKLGAEGSFITDFSQVWRVSARPVNVVDTTGAGDCFVAGFLHGLLAGLPLNECGNRGAQVAAMGIAQFGATTGIGRL